MNYLTIEKYTPHDGMGVFAKMFLALIILVVPFMITAVWLWMDLNSTNGLGQAAVEGNEDVGYESSIGENDGDSSEDIDEDSNNYSYIFINKNNN